MRILWLSHFLPYPPKGGVFQRAYHLLREAARRHDVTLVALNRRTLLPDIAAIEEAAAALRTVVPSVYWLDLPADRSRLRRSVTAAVSYLRSSPFDQNWLRSSALQRHLRLTAASSQFDIIHLDTLGLWQYRDAFAGVPAVLNHHNVESQMMARRASRERHLLQRHYFHRDAGKLERAERLACRCAAVNLVVSELDGERLAAVSPTAEIRVVPNGVDLEYFRPLGQPHIGRAGLIFAGGMNWYPNRDAAQFFLDQVWPLLGADGSSRTLTLVGQDPPAAVREAAVRDPQIRVPGFVDDVRPWLDQAAIYVCPIRDGGGTRLKILDALAMELPMVATGVAVEGLALTEGVHYLLADSPEEFVRQIRCLEANPPLARSLAERGRALVESRYGWGTVGEALDSAYQAAVSLRGT